MTGLDDTLTLEANGIEFVRAGIDPALLDRLRADTDDATTAELAQFGEGHPQYGRALFAPIYGGSFLELLEVDEVYEPIERRIGREVITYTMTTSVLFPQSAGPIDEYHVDLDPSRPDDLALAALIMLDDFTEETGATEFLARTPEEPAAVAPHRLHGTAGDICYFDPRLRHRSMKNSSSRVRRAVLFQMVQPWMKQRFDVRAMLADVDTTRCSETAKRRLGLTSTPPSSMAEFRARDTTRPWQGAG